MGRGGIACNGEPGAGTKGTAQGGAQWLPPLAMPVPEPWPSLMPLSGVRHRTSAAVFPRLLVQSAPIYLPLALTRTKYWALRAGAPTDRRRTPLKHAQHMGDRSRWVVNRN